MLGYNKLEHVDHSNLTNNESYRYIRYSRFKLQFSLKELDDDTLEPGAPGRPGSPLDPYSSE